MWFKGIELKKYFWKYEKKRNVKNVKRVKKCEKKHMQYEKKYLVFDADKNTIGN